MTLKKKLAGRHAGRHTLRSSAAVADLVGAPQIAPTTIEVDAWQVTDSTRHVLAHTSQEWNALRHAC